jgi:hypothetical protein
VRARRRITEATAAAAVLGGAPSTLLAAARCDWQLRPTLGYLRYATRAAGVVVPPHRPSLIRGALVHGVMSMACGELLVRGLPERRRLLWGTCAGLALGVVNRGVIGRRIPAIAALPVVPQLADHVAFGAIFVAVLDR